MSNPETTSAGSGVIRLTAEELAGNHVDDLLKRQMSLRGETGVTRGARKWYYRNWLVFLLVGACAAVVAWAIIEPFFDDMLYVQGSIEDLNMTEPLPQTFRSGSEHIELKVSGRGWLKIRGEKIWLLDGVKDLSRKHEVKPEELQRGQALGAYVLRPDESIHDLALCMYLVLSPPATPPAKALLPLEQQRARSVAAGLLLFPLVAGLVGLALGAVDGFICRLLRRALLSGLIGFLIGFIGGLVSTFLAGLVYMPLNHLALQQAGPGPGSLTTFGFIVQMCGRSLAWALAGLAMGLGQGVALRSKRLLLYGLMGGVLGGLIGGLLFDPIDLILLGTDKPSAHWSRLIGLLVIGASVGSLIGLVELLARDAWLRMVEGPLTGKEFLIFKDTMQLGASPRSDIYLFNDQLVAPHHATLRYLGEDCELENLERVRPALLNNRTFTTARLRHGDRITIGRTVFVYEKRQG